MEKTAVFLKRTEGPAVIESAGRMLTGLKCKHVQVKQVTMPKVNTIYLSIYPSIYLSVNLSI